MSPVAARLETAALEWIGDVLGIPPTARGAFVTGDTMANFSALVAARHALLETAGWDVEARGLFGAPPVTVVVGEEVHVSVLKALALVGFGRDRVVRVPADEQGRMRADRLPEFHGPTLVCAQAGNVNTGAFDPAREICERAHRGGAWQHFAAAFGLWAHASPARRALTTGIDGADSWATDAHKWLIVPYDSGVLFVREGRPLGGAMSGAASAYLPQSEQGEPMEYVPEMSRRARGVDAWAALRSLGRSGLADLVERCCRHASRMATLLRAGGCRILNDVVLNQVLVSFGSDDETRRVIDAVQRDGTCWCGGTVWHGTAAMRISVSSWATTDDDIYRSAAAALREVRRLGRVPASFAWNGVSPGRFGDPELVEHVFRTEEPRGDRDRGHPGETGLHELFVICSRQPYHAGLDQVVEEVPTVSLMVSVRDLEQNSLLPLDHQRHGVAAGQNVGEDRAFDQLSTDRIGHRPGRPAPFDQVLPSPDIVDEDIEPAVLSSGDGPKESADLGLDRVVDPDGVRPAPVRPNDPRSLVDRFGPAGGRGAAPHATPGGIDGRPRKTQAHGDRATGSSRRSGHEGDPPPKRFARIRGPPFRRGPREGPFLVLRACTLHSTILPPRTIHFPSTRRSPPRRISHAHQ